MYTQLVLATLAATAAAAGPNVMALPQVKREVLHPRQTALLPDLSQECASAVVDVAGSVPTPPPEIISDASANPQTDPCTFTPPDSLSSEYSSYSSEIMGWFSDHEGELQSAIDECPELVSYATQLPVCSAAIASFVTLPTGASASATATGSGGSETGGSDSGSGSGDATTTVPDNAAPRETGMVMGALAAAGLAVVAL